MMKIKRIFDVFVYQNACIVKLLIVPLSILSLKNEKLLANFLMSNSAKIGVTHYFFYDLFLLSWSLLYIKLLHCRFKHNIVLWSMYGRYEKLRFVKVKNKVKQNKVYSLLLFLYFHLEINVIRVYLQ